MIAQEATGTMRLQQGGRIPLCPKNRLQHLAVAVAYGIPRVDHHATLRSDPVYALPLVLYALGKPREE